MRRKKCDDPRFDGRKLFEDGNDIAHRLQMLTLKMLMLMLMQMRRKK